MFLLRCIALEFVAILVLGSARTPLYGVFGVAIAALIGVIFKVAAAAWHVQRLAGAT